MAAQAVEPQVEGRARLRFEELLIRRRVDRFRIVALVQRAAQVEGFLVEVDAPVAGGNGAKAAGCLQLVVQALVVPQFGAHGV